MSSVMNGSREFLTERNDVKMACCTYHHQHDGEKISRIIEDMGYTYEFSEGYMLFDLYDRPQYPFFGHVHIRARNVKLW